MLRPRAASMLAVALLAVAAASLTACSSSDQAVSTSAATGDLATRAQAGLLQSYTATYAVTKADGTKGDAVTVWRTPNRLRLDVHTAGGTATSITTPESTVACQRPTSGRTTHCFVVAGAGKKPPAAFDPALRKEFGDVLRVFAGGADGLKVVESPETEVPSPTSTPSGVTDVTCFVVSGSGGSNSAVVADGTYCLDADGVPVSLSFPSGSATLTSLTPGAPAATQFVPAATAVPLPGAS